jgi:hypothetical protein
MAHRPSSPPPPNPRLGERVWSLDRNGRTIDCELHSSARGDWDCLVVDDDWLISSRRLPSRADALACAEEQRQALIREGWIEPR